MYRVIKTINGHRYYYDQRTWREGGKVRCESIYVGPVDGGPYPTSGRTPARTPRAVNTTPPGPIAANTASHGLNTIGEDAFITELMGGKDQHWQPGYRWDAGPVHLLGTLRDPDILMIGVHMGVAMTTQMWRDDEEPDCPSYNRRLHRISIPDPARYWEVDGCSAERNLYVDTLHEVAHATQDHFHRPRTANRFLYAREEIIAEVAANLVARRLGVEPESPRRTQAYLAQWAAVVRSANYPHGVDWAIEQAKKTADHMLRFHPRGGWKVTT